MDTIEKIVQELRNNLMGKPLQWMVYGEGVRVRFDQPIKSVSISNFSGCILFNFKGAGAKNKVVSLDIPVTIEKIDNDKALMYHLFSSNGSKAITVGYLKEQ
jgi:hypothetical protein